MLVRESLDGEAPGTPIDHSAVLEPGVYELLVVANVDAVPHESRAYFAVSLSMDSASPVGEITPISLPPAAWTAVATLGAVGPCRGWRGLPGRWGGDPR